MSKGFLDYEKKRIISVCIFLHCTVFVAEVAKKLHTKRTHKDLVCCDEISVAFHWMEFSLTELIIISHKMR